MRAPAIIVELEAWMDGGDVLVRRVVRFLRTSDSIRRKGRYLLPALEVGMSLGKPFCFGPLSLRRLVGSERFSSGLSALLSAWRFDLDASEDVCSVGVG